jgi:hypothetical protein
MKKGIQGDVIVINEDSYNVVADVVFIPHNEQFENIFKFQFNFFQMPLAKCYSERDCLLCCTSLLHNVIYSNCLDEPEDTKKVNLCVASRLLTKQPFLLLQ